MSPAAYALALLEARAELLKRTRAAILSGKTESTTTLSTDSKPSITTTNSTEPEPK